MHVQKIAEMKLPELDGRDLYGKRYEVDSIYTVIEMIVDSGKDFCVDVSSDSDVGMKMSSFGTFGTYSRDGFLKMSSEGDISNYCFWFDGDSRISLWTDSNIIALITPNAELELDDFICGDKDQLLCDEERGNKREQDTDR